MDDTGEKDLQKRQRVLTGDRPTGALHLGHWVGSLENRLALQDRYECFFVIADLHALTTHYERTETLRRNIRELVLDYLSVEIDPGKSHIYLQSMVPEVTELATLLSMLVTVPRLQRMPALKEVMHDLAINTPSLGLLSYPVLQAADILMVRAHLVPVGADQASHVELTREIARRFNQLYQPFFPIPDILIGEVPSLPGIDGQAKMSKSLDNAIFLSDDAETVKRKVNSMYTDPSRIHPTDPGHVEGNPVFIYHDAFNPDAAGVEELKDSYRQGKVSDIEVKDRLATVLNNFLDPIRERRGHFAAQENLIEEILMQGTEVARRESQKTLKEVKKAMRLSLWETAESGVSSGP
jgi:tryptophanyl-tRNA synthetase